MQKQSSSEPLSSARDLTAPNDLAAVQRRRIIDAMVACSAEKTYVATTITDIVARASISRTTFYKHFEDKRSCFLAALEDCIEETAEAARVGAAGCADPVEAVRAGCATVLALFAAKPAVAQVLAAEAVAVDPSVPARYRGLLVPALERLLGGGERRLGAISPGLAFGRAQLLLLEEIAAGRADRLAELAPEMVYLALAPFRGHEAAVREARPAAPDRPEQLAPR